MPKYYVVWEGRHPGIYDDWEEVREQTEGFPGAKFKAFSSKQEATVAYRKYTDDGVPLGELLASASSGPQGGPKDTVSLILEHPEIDPLGWAVDASCLGNPGQMEYRGVEIATGREIFRVGPFDDATNNIGEFLAIVHALALQYKTGSRHTIYSDSATGMAWVRNRAVKTKLQPSPRNAKVFELVRRAIDWLHTHSYDTPIRKWQTEIWGEVPADFGRK